MKPILNVYPNPYCALDAAGFPCGAVPRHPDHGGYVGAKIDREATETTRKEVTETVRGVRSGKKLDVVKISGRQVTRWEFLGVPAAELKVGPEKLLEQKPARV